MDIRFSGTAYLDVMRLHLNRKELQEVLLKLGDQQGEFSAMVPFVADGKELLIRVESQRGDLLVLDIVEEFSIHS